MAQIKTLMFNITTLIITVYYTILTTNIATNKVSCLLYFRTQCKQYKSATSNIHSYFTKIHQACTPHRSENAKL